MIGHWVGCRHGSCHSWPKAKLSFVWRRTRSKVIGRSSLRVAHGSCCKHGGVDPQMCMAASTGKISDSAWRNQHTLTTTTCKQHCGSYRRFDFGRGTAGTVVGTDTVVVGTVVALELEAAHLACGRPRGVVESAHLTSIVHDWSCRLLYGLPRRLIGVLPLSGFSVVVYVIRDVLRGVQNFPTRRQRGFEDQTHSLK